MTHPVMQSNRAWQMSLIVKQGLIELLVTEQGKEVLYAQFSTLPIHPRALLFILEGLALWIGTRLCVVIYADGPVHPSLGLGHAGDRRFADSPLLEFVLIGDTIDRQECGA
jgi:hypothetical protein